MPIYNRHPTLGGLVPRGASAKGGFVGPYKVLLYGFFVSPGAPGAPPGPPEPLPGSPGRALVTLTVVLVVLEMLLELLETQKTHKARPYKDLQSPPWH